MCTEWEGAPTLMSTPKGSGFTLAHEWGHYAYGLYDEYVANCGQTPETNCPIWLPRSTDTRSNPSIMNNQWAAVSGSQDNLEFSTDDVAPYAGSTNNEGNDENAQARTFSEPAWDTLTRNPSSDPRHTFLPSRTQYTNLVAPAGPDFTQNDDESDARSELDIVWAGNQVVELMIDTSGSMGSQNKMANARTAGSLLVGTLTPGENAVGVGRFTSSASQIFPITDIPDPDTGVIAGAQAAINGLNATGGTDIEEAALLALSEVQGFQGGQRPSVVFLLTDGQSSVNESTVINAYTAAKVPLVTFGFGSGVNDTLLRNLANGTGGSYFFSPTNLNAIQQAFVAANAAFSSSVVVGTASSQVGGSTTETREVILDDTLASASINVTYTPPENDIALQLLDSSGAPVPNVAFVCSTGAEVSCNADVDVTAVGAGTYDVEIVNSGAQRDVSLLISGTPASFENFDIAVEFDDANYPESFTIEAAVSRGATLTGLTVTADVTKPDSSVITLTLLDDGVGADLNADDGIYTAEVPYDQNGSYTAVVTASNPSGNAQTTFNGLAVATQEDGTGVVPVPETVSANFTRAAVANALVSAFQADDHADDPTAPGLCTPVSDDNADTVGRIDSAADVDCFVFVPTTTTDDLVARVTALRSGMQPVVRIYDPTGTTELLTVDLSTSANDAVGAVTRIPASALDAGGHVVTVEHADNTATTGGYAFSVGAPIGSDEPVQQDAGGGGGDDGGSSGGALGPLGLLLFGLLAAVGLRQRRHPS